MAAEIRHDEDRSRFVAQVGGELAGSAEYELRDGRITFTHTVVGPAFEGQGVGSALATAGLDEARRQGLRVTPRCSFIASYIDEHPEYADLVSG